MRSACHIAGGVDGWGCKMKHILSLIWVLCLTACGKAGPLDQLEPGEEARVVRILDGDTLALNTGLVVKLASLEAPSFGRGDEPDQTYAKESARILEDLTMGRQVRLAYPGITRDRYDRAIAHIETIDNLGKQIWVNREVARQGGARVRVYADTAALAEHLLSAEADAKLERAGLWGKRDYSNAAAEIISASYRGFAVIEGTTLGSAGPGGRFAKCRISLEGAAMLLEISDTAAAHCDLPSGTRLRARGYMRGGRMEITHPLNLTVLPQSS